MIFDEDAVKPRKSARQARSAATVEVILEAAARILENPGPSGFTTNAIADRAGVSVGSLYQYFPNKDAITRALIRRELEALETTLNAIDRARTAPAPLDYFIDRAVAQQLHRPLLAKVLEVEEDRLGADRDRDPVRARIATLLSKILADAGHPAGHDIVQDVMALIATLVNAAASRSEDDAANLRSRVKMVIDARLKAL